MAEPSVTQEDVINDAYLAWVVEALPGPQLIPPPKIIFRAGWIAAMKALEREKGDNTRGAA